MYKKIIDDLDGDIIIKCKDKEIKGISYILKHNDVMKSILSGNYKDKEITVLEEFSSESVKYFLLTFYSNEKYILIQIESHKLMLFMEFMQICDILCYEFEHSYTLLIDILNSNDKFVINDIMEIMKSHKKENFLSEKHFEIFIDFLVYSIEHKTITIEDLDIPYEYMLIMINKIMKKCNFFENEETYIPKYIPKYESYKIDVQNIKNSEKYLFNDFSSDVELKGSRTDDTTKQTGNINNSKQYSFDDPPDGTNRQFFGKNSSNTNNIFKDYRII